MGTGIDVVRRASNWFMDFMDVYGFGVGRAAGMRYAWLQGLFARGKLQP